MDIKAEAHIWTKININFKSLLNIVSELPEDVPELHHVLGDGVEVLESAVDVTRTFIQIQSVVQDHLVAKIVIIFL